LETNEIADVKLAQSGQHEAFIRLVRKAELQMYHIAKAIVKHEEDCADAMQETVLKAYKSIKTLRQPAYFKTWLLRILINECNTLLRKRLHTTGVDTIMQQADHTPNQDYTDLWDAILRLDEIPRTIIILHYFQDQPLRQIAQLLEMSESAVKTRLHRSRHALSEWLTDSTERTVHYETH